MSVATASYVKNAQTASYYVETDPVFVAKSGSLATTGSNNFKGNQTITGSLNLTGSLNIIGDQTTIGNRILTGSWFVTGSSYLTGNTILSGSILVSGSQTFKGNLDLTGSLIVSGSTVQIGSNTLTGNTTLSGSIYVSGSQTFVGNLNLTGSLTVSGSTTQIGNNSLTGNTSLSGSITISGSTTNRIIGNTNVYGEFNVSGSSVFSNSFFTVTGSTFVKGATNISGSTNITGSFNVTDGNINVVSGSGFYRWGNKLFNYGVFSSALTQSGSANTILSMSFDSTDVGGAGVSLVNGSKITVENTGIYNLQFSSQFNRISSGTDTITIWFAYTGSSIANSATDVVLTGGANVNATVASWNYVLPMSASSYVQIFWSTPDVHVEMSATGTRTVPTRPAVPSVIATLTQIA
jgi:hypothetical protein